MMLCMVWFLSYLICISVEIMSILSALMIVNISVYQARPKWKLILQEWRWSSDMQWNAIGILGEVFHFLKQISNLDIVNIIWYEKSQTYTLIAVRFFFNSAICTVTYRKPHYVIEFQIYLKNLRTTLVDFLLGSFLSFEYVYW